MLEHVHNRQVLDSADNLEAFTPLTSDDIQAVREGVAVDRLARAIGEAVTTIRPDVKVDGYVARYPFGEAPLDLRVMARALIYHT